MPVITENEVENIFIQELQNLGYRHLIGSEISSGGLVSEREYHEVVLKSRLEQAIAMINPKLPHEAREEALRKVLRSDSPNLYQSNYTFHRYLTEGVEVEFRKGDRIAGDKVWLRRQHQQTP